MQMDGDSGSWTKADYFWAAVDKASRSLDDFNAIQDVTSNSSVLEWVKNGTPELSIAFAAFGENAPLVGLAFTALNMAGRAYFGERAVQAAYEDFAKSVVTVADVILKVDLFRQAEEKLKGTTVRVPQPVADVRTAFLVQLADFCVLLGEHRGKGYMTRMFTQSSARAKLADIQVKIDAARNNLLMANVIVAGERLERILHLEEARTTGTTLNLDNYATAVLSMFSKSLQLGTIDPEGFNGHQHLGLEDVFIPQTVRPCNLEDLVALELPADHIEFLKRTNQLTQDETSLSQLLRESVERMHTQTARSVTELLADVNCPSCVIVGAPGSGKSSSVRDFAIRWADLAPADRENAELPVLVELRQYANERAANKSLFEYICNGGSADTKMEPIWLERQFVAGHVLLLLDGLDEVFDPKTYDTVVKDIRTFARTYEGKGVRIVVTSRIVGYNAHSLANVGFAHYAIQPFNPQQINEFLSKWYAKLYAGDARQGEVLKNRLRTSVLQNEAVAELATNPLLLTMMAIINRGMDVPTRRSTLYAKCVELMIARWRSDLAIQAVYEREGQAVGATVRAFDPVEKEELLCALAWRMQETGTELGNLVQRDSLNTVFRTFVAQYRGSERAPELANALIDQLRGQHGILCYLGGASYAFAHRTFLEYFCALSIYKAVNAYKLSPHTLRDILIAHANDSTWSEVIALTCAMVETNVLTISNTLEAILNMNLELVCACVKQLKTPGSAHLAINAVRAALVSKIENEDVFFSRNHTTVPLLLATFPDQSARDFLTNLAKAGHFAAGNAVRGLVDHWRDDTTRSVLSEVAKGGLQGADTAVKRLTTYWRDDTTRLVLVEVAMAGRVGADNAVNDLAEYWFSDATRGVLMEVVKGGLEGAYAAINRLAEHWCDETTRDVLTNAARSGFHAADAAVDGLANHWRDNSTRDVLTEIATCGLNGADAAVSGLMLHWRDDTSRGVLIEVAKGGLRGATAAVHHLGENWRDNRMRDVLAEVAKGGLLGADAAVKSLTTYWRDDATRSVLVEVANRGLHGADVATQRLVDYWRDDGTRMVLTEVAKSGLIGSYVAASGLANHWRDDATRRILEEVAKLGLQGADAAVSRLAQHWRDDSTRTLLVDVAISGLVGAGNAVNGLAQYWRDDETFHLLTEIATSGKLGADTAVNRLAQHWPNDATRGVLTHVAKGDKHGAYAGVILLTEHWRDETTRSVLTEIAQRGLRGADAAVASLTQHWRDDVTHNLLLQVAKAGLIGADSALNGLAAHWRDDTTRELLMETAKSDLQGAKTAVNLLVEHWRDDRTRDVLTVVAKCGFKGASAAVNGLRQHWRDTTTRNVLVEVAKGGLQGADVAVKRLAQHWADETTRIVMAESAAKALIGSTMATCCISRFWYDNETFQLLHRQAVNENGLSLVSLLMLAWRSSHQLPQITSDVTRAASLNKGALQELKSSVSFIFGYQDADSILLTLLVRAVRAGGLILSRQTLKLLNIGVHHLESEAPGSISDT